MNAITYMILVNELTSHDYSAHGQYNVANLFKIYTSREFTKLDNILTDHRCFSDFVRTHIDSFYGATRDDYGEIIHEEKVAITGMARHLSSKLNALHSKFYAEHRKQQEDFVETVEKICGHSHVNLLEVGSGEIPYSSILLARDMGEISSMDKFSISEESLRSLNINPINHYFDENDSVDEYDIIVGQKPCSAIAEIIRKCAQSRKPYFIQLCQCNSPNHELAGWQEYLELLDPRIRFSNYFNFAYNLDAPWIEK